MRLAFRINHMLEGYFPEQRLYLKSDTETRFIRLRPWTQAVATVAAAFFLAWTILATAILMMDWISAGTSREQIARQQTLYEERLTALSADRDLRAEEAASAQHRFNLAMAQVSTMQARFLASEDRRRELETGIDVIQNTLRRTIEERDEARTALAALETGTNGLTDGERMRDAVETVQILTSALGGTARERDRIAVTAEQSQERADRIANEMVLLRRQGDAIFAQLDEALQVSVEPLEKMFLEAGLSPEDLIKAVRQGYDGQGGPLTPISLSTKSAAVDEMTLRANDILAELNQMNMYRIAAFKAPFGMPVRTAFRWTSGFGVRQDPKGWGRRMHEGVDMAGATGSPIYSTADGVVTHAGWSSGYGRLVKVRHAFGLETRYGHLSEIDVAVGQKVSRGEQIGAMGNSGRSTGTHLHYEVRAGDRAINPMIYIKAGNHVF